MASVKKFGEAVVLTSAVKLEDIKKLAKYRPEALVLKDEDDEPVFCVGLSNKKTGAVSKYGVEFGGCSEDGFAQATFIYNGPEEDVKAALADSIGPQVVLLAKLEETFPAVLHQIDADVAAIMACIEVG